MSFKLRVTGAGVLARIALLGAVTGMLAGCSSEVTRFAEGATDPTPTGTALIPSVPVGAGPNDLVQSAAPIRSRISSAPIQSRALPAPNPSYSAPSTPNPRLAASSIPSRASTPVRETTSAISSRASGATSAAMVGNWSAIGGSPVTVGQGENLNSLSSKYGVPSDVLLKSNGLTSSQVQPGTRLVIPVYNAGGAATAVHTPVVSAPARIATPKVEAPKIAEAPKAAVPKGRESLQFTRGAGAVATKAQVTRIEPKKPEAKKVAPAKPVAAKAAPAAKVALGKAQDKMPAAASEAKTAKPAQVAKVEPVKPASKAADKGKVEKPAKVAEAPKVDAKAKPPKGQQIAKVETAPVEAKAPRKIVTDATPIGSVPSKAEPVPAPVQQETASDSANPEFRWPAKGRVIQSFKPGTNEGINISVPEGTSGKAAESGVVAYAGSELKNYGNLVLIRHPNGFVTAYANNGEIEVKRGDTVKRGQTIAKSGQTGNVNAPQLHFELRKGSTPVDPTGHLPGL